MPAPAAPIEPAVIAVTDWLVPNEHEFALIGGAPLRGDTDAEDAALRDLGSRLAVSTNLLASLISLLMRATGQARNLTGPLDPEEAPVVVARAILGEWLGGSGGGWQDSAFFESVAPEVYNYHFVQEDWDMSGVQNKEWIKEVAQQCKDTYGYEMSSFFAQGWTAAYVAYYALEAAGTTDHEKLRDAIAGLDIKNSDDERALLTGYSEIVFDEHGQNTYGGGPTGGTIIQYQDGKAVALYPAEHSSGGKAVLPIPPFSER